MRNQYEARVAEQTEIQRQIRRDPTKMSVSKFGPVAKLLWPFKTAAVLADIAKKDTRTAERWLSGEYEPPAIVIAAIIVEITKRE